jgi:hypothetical protein
MPWIVESLSFTNPDKRYWTGHLYDENGAAWWGPMDKATTFAAVNDAVTAAQLTMRHDLGHPG